MFLNLPGAKIMSSDKALFKLVIDGAGEALLSIDYDRGFSILTSLLQRETYDTYAVRRDELILVKVDVERGVRGLPGIHKRGALLYSPIEDSLVIVVNDFKSMEKNYSQVGVVEEGLENIEGFEGVAKARLIRL